MFPFSLWVRRVEIFAAHMSSFLAFAEGLENFGNARS